MTGESLPNTSGGNVSAGTKGYTTTESASGYTFSGGEIITLAVTGKGVTSRPTTEERKLYTVASGAVGGNALTYSRDADGTSVTYPFDWLSTAETLTLRAWSDAKTTAPAAAADPDGAAFSVETTQTGSVRELLYAPAADYTYAAAGGAIAVPLYHQLARIVVSVAMDDEDDPATAITIGHDSDGHRVPLTGTFTKPATPGSHYGTWSVATPAVQPTHWGVITPKTESAGTYSAVLIPATLAAGTKLIHFTVGGYDFAYTLPAATTLEPGKQYNYDITVKNLAVSFTVSVTPWAASARQVSFPI